MYLRLLNIRAHYTIVGEDRTMKWVQRYSMDKKGDET